MLPKRFRILLIPTVAPALLAGCSLLEPRPDDPVMLKLAEIERRLEAVERVVQNQSLVTMNQQVTALERQVAELHGTTESLGYDATTTADRQRQLYADLDDRIRQMEANLQALRNVNVLDGGQLEPGELPLPGGSDRDNYNAAFELLKEQRYEPAAIAFRQFLVRFPDSDLVANAQYWLAETQYVTNNFDEALRLFNVVVTDYPRSGKVADAWLKIGFCNYELQAWDAARQALAHVQSEFSETTAARLAGQRLERMNAEGV